MTKPRNPPSLPGSRRDVLRLLAAIVASGCGDPAAGGGGSVSSSGAGVDGPGGVGSNGSSSGSGGSSGSSGSGSSGSGTSGDVGGSGDTGGSGGQAFPMWRTGRALNQWFTLSGTILSELATDSGTVSPGAMNDYSGVVQNETDNEYVAFGGGHGGSNDNTVSVLNLMEDTPAWAVQVQPTPVADRITMPSRGLTDESQAWWGTSPNLKPNPPHTYSSGQWVSSLGRYMWFGYFGPYNAAGGVDSRVLQLMRDPAEWVQPGDPEYLASGSIGRNTCQAPDGTIYGMGSGEILHRFDPSQPFGAQFSEFVSNPGLNWSGYGALVYDTLRDQILRMGDAYSGLSYRLITVPEGLVSDVAPLLNGDAAVLSGLNLRVQTDTVGTCYDAINDRFVVPTGTEGGSFNAIDADMWAVTLESPGTSEGVVLAGPNASAGIYGRIHFNAALKCLVYFPSGSADVAILPLAD